MFDGSLAGIAELAGLDDATLSDTAVGWARVEAAAAARKLATMAEMFTRRTDTPTAEDRDLWWVDPSAAVGAELGASQGISTWNALSQARIGVVVRDRLPAVGALFAAGLVDADLVRATVWCTHLIQDPDALARVDADLAAQIMRWGAWSDRAVRQAIDALIIEHDPGALRRGKAAVRARYVDFGSPGDEPGTTSMNGRLQAHNAELLDSVVDEMARSVCANDPRTLDQRRSDALGALAAHTDLACLCHRDDCTAGTSTAPVRNVVVHVVADRATVEAVTGTRAESSDDATDDGAAKVPDDLDDETSDDIATRADDAPADDVAPAFLVGGGVLPAYALAEVLPFATVRPVIHPGDAPPEPGYAPSQALADFVRCRDFTCRFPYCDKPADRCDIDHTVPHPLGCTHASNLKCLCRFHHLLKTFWVGEGGWKDRQMPDGTIIWTAPTGHEYATLPGSMLHAPALARPTGTLALPHSVPAFTGDRAVMMPKRARTRAESTMRAIAAERRLNDAFVAECNAPPPF
ncbi:DUF222 domain-containing protein [Mycobacterium sp. LTG2003]